MRLLCTAVLALSAGLFAACADDKNGPAKDTPAAADRAERLKKIQAGFKEEFDELLKKFQAAKDPAEKNGVRTEARELASLTVGKILKLVEEDPKDAISVKAIEFTVASLLKLGAGGADMEKLVGIITEHHLNNPEIKGLVLMAGSMGPAGEKLQKAAAEKSTDKGVKATALFALGQDLSKEIDNESNEKVVEQMTAKAIDYLEKAKAEAPDVALGRQTIGKAAEVEIQALKSLGIGKPAPDAEGTDLDGKKVKLSSYKGNVVLLDIWATWCGPCRAMIPHERELVKKLYDKPFVLLSVSADNDKETLTSFLEKEPMPWSHWWAGPDSPVMKMFRVKAFPTMYLIDAKGVVRKKWVGSPGNDVLDKAVEDLVKEATTKR